MRTLSYVYIIKLVFHYDENVRFNIIFIKIFNKLDHKWDAVKMLQLLSNLKQ